MRKILLAILVLILLLNPENLYAAQKRKSQRKKSQAQSQSQAQNLIRVEVEGVAPVINENLNEARGSARRDMMRNALENAIGTFVQSVSKMENFEVVKDRVFTQTQGLVKRVDVKREWVDADGLLHLSGTCDVAEKNLDAVLGPAVIDALGNPRIVILIDERVGNKVSFMSTAEGEVHKVFERAGFTIIDHRLVLNDGAIDVAATMMSQSPEGLLQVANACNADVVICGTAYSEQISHQRRLGVNLYNMRSRVRLRAILVDTRQTLGFEEGSTHNNNNRPVNLNNALGQTPEDGAVRGLRPSAESAAKNIVNRIAYALASGNSNGISGRTVKIIISGIDFRTGRLLREKLQNLGGVNGVYQRNFKNNRLELDIVSDKNSEEIAEYLSDNKFEITGVSGAQVEANGASYDSNQVNDDAGDSGFEFFGDCFC